METQNTSDFAALGAAPMPKGSREFINDGRYIVQIDKVKKVRSVKRMASNGVGELMVIIEMTVLEVLQEKVYMGRNKAGEIVEKRSNEVGDLCLQVIKMNWNNAYSMVKGFLAAAMELSPSVCLDLERKSGAWPEIMDRAVHGIGECLDVDAQYLDDDGAPVGEPWVVQPLSGVEVGVRGHTVPQKNNPNADFTEIEYSPASAS